MADRSGRSVPAPAPAPRNDGNLRNKFPELYRSDVSIQPSYTRLHILPYDVVCRRRLAAMNQKMRKQFDREIKYLISMQTNAMEGMILDALLLNRD